MALFLLIKYKFILLRRFAAVLYFVMFFLLIASPFVEPGVSVALYNVKQFTGNVVDVNAGDRTVTIEKNGKKVVLHVDGSTKILENKQKISIYEIAPGSRVKVKYTEINGHNAAKSIIVGPP